MAIKYHLHPFEQDSENIGYSTSSFKVC